MEYGYTGAVDLSQEDVLDVWMLSAALHMPALQVRGAF